MKELCTSALTILTLTIGVYTGALYIYKKFKFPLLHPLLISIAILIGYLKITGIQYEQFAESTAIINMMLGPSVVALGYLLYTQISNIRGNITTILTSISVGSVVGIVSVVLIARWMGADSSVVSSLEPKSVTTAIALSISANSGGIPALTSVVVIIVGIFGGIAGPFILRLFGVDDHVAQGLAMGSAAHAMGTARAIEMGAIQGAIGGLAIAVMGVITAILIPILGKIL